MVVEDSLIGLQAALGAGMPCIITYTPSTKEQDFKGARAVVPELGEEGPAAVTAQQLRSMVLGVKA
jgi:beta-phosphoglucomutase-like phosphatase (HAD superfamily)